MVEENRILNRLLKHKNFGLPNHWITRHLIETKEEVSLKKVRCISGYRKKVMKLTELVKHLVPGVEKRGFTTHHIDHKIPVWYGYKTNIPPEEIAHIDNLRMLPAKDNILKGRKCV